MEDMLHSLEARIKTLMQQCEHLKQNNLKLRHTKSVLVREREQMLLKHKMAISQIENMVTRLKSLEEMQ